MSNQTRRDRNPQNAAYEEGYRTGRDSQLFTQEDNYATRESSTASGLMLGLTLALLAALAGGAAYFWSQREEPTQRSTPAPQIIPVPVPNNNNSQPQNTTPKNETTIIERTIDRTRDVVPVPTTSPSPQSSSQDSSTSRPNINITVPPAQQPTGNTTSPAPSDTNNSSQESSSSNQ